MTDIKVRVGGIYRLENGDEIMIIGKDAISFYSFGHYWTINNSFMPESRTYWTEEGKQVRHFPEEYPSIIEEIK
jgi:hypothetical protein